MNAGGRSKLPPFFPYAFAGSGDPLQEGAPAFEQAAAIYFGRIASWGHNTVRLPFTWDAVEPIRGEYDEVYLGRYEAMIEAAAVHELRIIVDFHQDVFSRLYCGDGFPLWAAPEPHPALPDAAADCASWFLAYLSAGPHDEAYARFWAGDDDLQLSFEAMWTEVAGRTWDHDNVIGYEIINEPHEGTEQPGIHWPTDVLAPFYSRLHDVIRAAAPDALVFFDATGTDAIGQTTELPRPAGAGLVFAPHFYDASVFLLVAGGDFDVSEGLGRWAAKKAEWSLPVLVGEFGIKPTAEGAANYIRANFDGLDEHLMHGTAWEVSTTEDDWNDEAMSFVLPDGSDGPTVDELVRVYPSATSGTVEAFTYDRAALTGTLTWQAVPGETLLVIPQRTYPEGAHGALAGVEGAVVMDHAAERLRVTTTAAGTATLEFGPIE